MQDTVGAIKCRKDKKFSKQNYEGVGAYLNKEYGSNICVVLQQTSLHRC